MDYEDEYEYAVEEQPDDAYDFLFSSDDAETDSGAETDEEEQKHRLKRVLREEALARVEEAARTEQDYLEVLDEWDRLDRNRTRRNQRHEFLRGDVPLEFGMKNTYDALIYPAYRMAPTERQLQRGNFLDFLADCPYEMHDLTDKGYIRSAILDMKDDHKELLYFLGIKLMSPAQVAAFRGQTDRNVRKVRATMLRRVQKRLYAALRKMSEDGYSLSLRERSFLLRYEAEMMTSEQSV